MNYLSSYKDTEMYHIMHDGIMSNTKEKKPSANLEDDVMNLTAREKLKQDADKLAKYWLIDGAMIMKDIAHRHSYLEAYPEKNIDFFEYVEWKYTNTDLLT